MENGAKANEGLPHTRNQDGSDSIESEVKTPLTWEKKWLWVINPGKKSWDEEFTSS